MPAKSPTKKPARKKSGPSADLYQGASFGAQEAVDLGQVLGHSAGRMVTQDTRIAPPASPAPTREVSAPQVARAPMPEVLDSRREDVPRASSAPVIPAPAPVRPAPHPFAHGMMWTAITCVMVAVVGVWGISLSVTWHQLNAATAHSASLSPLGDVGASLDQIQQQLGAFMKAVPVSPASQTPPAPAESQAVTKEVGQGIETAMRALLTAPTKINENK